MAELSGRPCVVVTIPLAPHAHLSPNARVHWAERAEQVAMARAAARWATADALSRGALIRPVPATGPLAVRWAVFWGHRQRRRDLDGAVAMLKPFLDGLSDALAINDRRFAAVEVEQHRDPDGRGYVQVEVSGD